MTTRIDIRITLDHDDQDGSDIAAELAAVIAKAEATGYTVINQGQTVTTTKALR